MNQFTQLKQLRAIADVAFEAERTKLAKLNLREASLRQTLRDLDQARSDRSNMASRMDEPAVIAGADMQWHRWIDHRRSVLNTELAQVLALKSRQLAQVQKLFGRQQALTGLLDQARKRREILFSHKMD